MCATSVIMDYGSKIQRDRWTKESLDGYKSLIEKAKEWDKKIGEADCDDPEKGRWIEAVEDRLNKIGKMVPTEVSYDELPDSLKKIFGKSWTKKFIENIVECTEEN